MIKSSVTGNISKIMCIPFRNCSSCLDIFTLNFRQYLKSTITFWTWMFMGYFLFMGIVLLSLDRNTVTLSIDFPFTTRCILHVVLQKHTATANPWTSPDLFTSSLCYFLLSVHNLVIIAVLYSTHCPFLTHTSTLQGIWRRSLQIQF